MKTYKLRKIVKEKGTYDIWKWGYFLIGSITGYFLADSILEFIIYTLGMTIFMLVVNEFTKKIEWEMVAK